MPRRFGKLLGWIGILFVAAGAIIVLVVVPGWFWCATAAAALIAIGIFLLWSIRCRKR